MKLVRCPADVVHCPGDLGIAGPVVVAGNELEALLGYMKKGWTFWGMPHIHFVNKGDWPEQGEARHYVHRRKR